MALNFAGFFLLLLLLLFPLPSRTLTRFVFASQKAFANEPIGMQSQSERIVERVWLIVNCWLSNSSSYETTEERRRARNRDLHHGNVDIPRCLLPVNSDFDKLRAWFPNSVSRNPNFLAEISKYPFSSSRAFTSDFCLILRIESLVQFKGSWLGFKASTKWLNVLHFRKFKPRATWLNL